MRLVLILTGLLIGVPIWASSAAFVEGSDFSGKPVKIEAKQLVVVFLSSKCPCSNSHSEEVRALASEFPKYKFVAVNSNREEEPAIARAYFDRLKYPFPVLRDQDQKIVNHFKAVRTPHAFVLNENGETVFQGGLSDSSDFPSSKRKYLREALIDVSAGKKVRTPHARPLGCSIVRGE